MNKVFLSGALGKDPELRHTSTGKAVVSFSVATNEGSGEKKTTTWHNIVAWEKTAELCAKYLAKGSKVIVEGKITERTWEGKDGKKNYKTEIVASHVEFIGEKKTNDVSNEPQQRVQTEYSDIDNIPF